MTMLHGKKPRRWLYAAIGIGVVALVSFAIVAATDLDGDDAIGWDECFTYNTNQGPFGPFIHNSAIKYAIDRGMTDTNLIKMFLPMEADGLDSGEKAFMDYVTGFDAPLQQKVVDGFLSDGRLSSDEVHQIEFLKQFPKTEQVGFIESGKFADFNWDGDTYTNYFEKFIAGTPYDVKNEVYVIFSTSASVNYKDVTEMYSFLIETAKIQEDHIYGFHSEPGDPSDIAHYKTNPYGLHYKTVNPKNLEDAINTVSQKAGKNDTVLVILNGGGLEGYFFPYHDGDSVSYQWINDKLGKIDSKATIIPILACHSGSAIPYLEDRNKPRIILTNSAAKETSDFGIDYEFLQAFMNKSADKDGNGYVSVGEAAEYAKNVGISHNTHPQLSDINNLGPNLYLVEFEV